MQAVTQIPPTPDRPADAHKGTFGTVIVVGGCATMPGAPALCATAALRGGVGLVKLACPSGALSTAIAIEPGATGIAFDDDADHSIQRLDGVDPRRTAILAVGPGLGRSDAAAALVARLLTGKRAMVLDADGLNLLAASGRARPADGPPVVMTPHPGEFTRLATPLGISDDPTHDTSRPSAAAKLAQAHRCAVLLKGRSTVVTDGDRCYLNTTGNPAMATAGSGDVLTGLIASLIAQGMTLFDAACLGAYLHGLAGDLWAARNGPSGLTARDLANELPGAFQRRRNQSRDA